ncbi:iron complex transport system ATP-binding protein [Lachnospiraceae bacterium XBB1006]|nr:iron complex transport system ATP-binding protein [Lachnospiraceae bacterium XBB1006]
MQIITCKELHAAYDAAQVGNEKTEVLKGVSFGLEEGRSVCVLGSNGCGKTTLLRALVGMVPASGEVTIFGKNMNDMNRREIAKHVAVMTQLSEVYFSYRVSETVMMGRYVYQEGLFGRPGKKDYDVVEQCMDAVGLLPLRNRALHTLSGGELQRVFLARTLAQQTPILILDEPTNHLDLRVQAELADYLKAWSKEPGHTLVGVFHDISLALHLADDVLLMKRGRIHTFCSREEILSSGALEEAYEFDVLRYLRERGKELESTI